MKGETVAKKWFKYSTEGHSRRDLGMKCKISISQNTTDEIGEILTNGQRLEGLCVSYYFYSFGCFL
jgi:hypothetical protein